MKALTIYESLQSKELEEFQKISKQNSSIKFYFDSMFAFLIKEIPPVDASEFLDENEEEVIKYYKKGINVFDAAIILRQSYEKYLHRFDDINKILTQ